MPQRLAKTNANRQHRQMAKISNARKIKKAMRIGNRYNGEKIVYSHGGYPPTARFPTCCEATFGIHEQNSREDTEPSEISYGFTPDKMQAISLCRNPKSKLKFVSKSDDNVVLTEMAIVPIKNNSPNKYNRDNGIVLKFFMEWALIATGELPH